MQVSVKFELLSVTLNIPLKEWMKNFVFFNAEKSHYDYLYDLKVQLQAPDKYNFIKSLRA